MVLPYRKLQCYIQRENGLCLEMRLKENSKGTPSNNKFHSLESTCAVAATSHFSIIDREGNHKMKSEKPSISGK